MGNRAGRVSSPRWSFPIMVFLTVLYVCALVQLRSFLGIVISILDLYTFYNAALVLPLQIFLYGSLGLLLLSAPLAWLAYYKRHKRMALAIGAFGQWPLLFMNIWLSVAVPSIIAAAR